MHTFTHLLTPHPLLRTLKQTTNPAISKKAATKTWLKATLLAVLATIAMPAIAADNPAPSITDVATNSSVVWIMVAAILVFLMQAGFALLESGSSRAKNAVNVMMKNYTDMCVGALVFYLVGFGFMMGLNETGWIGLSHFAPNLTTHYDWAILFFQMMFAATAVTIASGAMAERAHFGAYIIASILICGLVYPVFASWVWGGYFGGSGWLADLGFIDFAGSTVVHGIGGWAALAGVVVLGPRLGRFSPDGEARDIPGHNITLVALGGFILWFGWFGFNAGSSVDAGANLGKIAINTQLAAAASVVAVMLIAPLRGKSILLSDTVNASLAGLVAITAGCATMSPVFAILTGFIAGFVYKFGCLLLEALKIDDVVNAVPIHALAGAWGTLATGLFFEGDMFNPTLMAAQGIGICVAFIWGFGVSFVVYLLINAIMGLRASAEHEQRGLDSSEHAEMGYPEFQRQVLFDEREMLTRR